MVFQSEQHDQWYGRRSLPPSDKQERVALHLRCRSLQVCMCCFCADEFVYSQSILAGRGPELPVTFTFLRILQLSHTQYAHKSTDKNGDKLKTHMGKVGRAWPGHTWEALRKDYAGSDHLFTFTVLTVNRLFLDALKLFLGNTWYIVLTFWFPKVGTELIFFP